MSRFPWIVFSARRALAFTLALCLICAPSGPLLFAQSKSQSKRPGGRKNSATVPPAKPGPARPAEKSGEEQLAQLARGLREEETQSAYARLSDFAARNAGNELGARAALALGYYDYAKNRIEPAQRWLDRAAKFAGSGREFVLREYAVYWRALVNRALGREADALAQLQSFRRDYPESVMTEQALQALGGSALTQGKSQETLAALNAYDRSAARPPLLLLRAQAHERAAEDRIEAARDYQALYYRFPLSDEARIAGEKLPQLQQVLGADFPAIPVERQIARATLLFDARRWNDARNEYEKLLPRLTSPAMGQEQLRAQLRLAQIRYQTGANPGVLAELGLSDPELDAERLYSLSQAWRSQKQEEPMLAAAEQLASRYPQSRWAEEGLFAAGNYFWVNLDRERAASFYRRALAQSPQGKYSLPAQWRVAWVAYVGRRPDAASLLEEHIRRFPGSSYTVDALYWLGRSAERDNNVAHARSFYLKAQERFPQAYFGRAAGERLRLIGASPVNSADFLALIPAPPPLPRLEEPIPATAAGRWARAQALRTIAFDGSAELELRAGYAATGSPRLLWEATKAASDAGHYAVGFGLIRQLYPQLEARRFDEIPPEAWQALYPFPYQTSLKRAAARNHVDPMLVAGVIRQESGFQPDAVSRAGAVGLMQVLPKTGRNLARELRLRYAHQKLFDPEYNLLLGTRYLSELLKTQGDTESALATFNAGEDRVAAWKAERSYDEPAEFVESIPFTETREYVQIVMRNAELYRRVYGNPR